MGVNFRELMIGKSNEDLQKYLDNCITYTPEAVEYAIAEMQKRGRIFSDDELIGIRQEMQLKSLPLEAENKEVWGRNKNVVTDENAPSYYSEKAIYCFGTAFGVLFGSVLLAINVNNTETKKGIWPVIGFGILFTGFQIWILSFVPQNSLSTTVCSMIGTLLMNYMFWGKYIGKDTKYRTKPIWKPLIIGLVIFTPLVVAIIYQGV